MNTEVDDPDKPPVFVLDGIIVNGIDDVDPESIERIDVIKSTESPEAKKYNAEHVILVTTKNAKSSEDKIKKTGLGTIKKTGHPAQDADIFFVVEDMPSFRSGKAELKTYIYSNLEYPSSMKNKGISGEVMVQFLVKASGKLEEIKVASSTHRDFEEPALEIFRNMPDWNPGSQRGKPVNVNVVVPVRFDPDTI